MLKRTTAVFLMLLFLLALPVVSQASSSRKAKAVRVHSLGAAPADAESTDDLRYVSWFTDEKNLQERYLFIPSSWDLSEGIRIWFKADGAATLDDKPLLSGEVVQGLETGKKMTLRTSTRKYFLTVMQSSEIPTVYLTIDPNELTKIHKSKENTTSGDMLVVNPDGSVLCSQQMKEIRCRGNTSFTKPQKKSYQVKLTDGVEFIEGQKNKTWLLVTGFRDRSYMRNKLFYDAAAYTGLAYSASGRHVDVYINHEYKGIYLLCEKAEVDKDRVDIADLEEETKKLNDQPLSSYPQSGTIETPKKGQGKWYEIPNDPDDITGGYLVTIRGTKHYAESSSGYVTQRKTGFDVKSPKCLSAAQYTYLSTKLQNIEDAIYAEDGIDPATGLYYTDLIDLDSFASKYVLDEMVMSYDCNRNSQYMYKPADSVSTKVFAGPAWDFDTSAGTYASEVKTAALNPEGYWANVQHDWGWWPVLWKHEDFREAAVKVWKEKYLPAMRILLGEETDPEGKLVSIDEYAETIRASAEMDFVRWPKAQYWSGKAKPGRTFDANITYLKDFLKKRCDWLIGEWGE